MKNKSRVGVRRQCLMLGRITSRVSLAWPDSSEQDVRLTPRARVTLNSQARLILAPSASSRPKHVYIGPVFLLRFCFFCCCYFVFIAAVCMTTHTHASLHEGARYLLLTPNSSSNSFDLTEAVQTARLASPFVCQIHSVNCADAQ